MSHKKISSEELARVLEWAKENDDTDDDAFDYILTCALCGRIKVRLEGCQKQSDTDREIKSSSSSMLHLIHHSMLTTVISIRDDMARMIIQRLQQTTKERD
jgi:hypothetical protein